MEIFPASADPAFGGVGVEETEEENAEGEDDEDDRSSGGPTPLTSPRDGHRAPQ